MDAWNAEEFAKSMERDELMGRVYEELDKLSDEQLKELLKALTPAKTELNR